MGWNAKKQRQERFRRQFGENPLHRSGAEWIRERLDKIKIYQEETQVAIDDIMWNDLEMDEVFLRINNTKSFMGEQVLYQRLHDLNWCEEWERLENKVEYLTEKEEMRLILEEKLATIGKQEEHYYLPSFILHAEYWKVEKEWGLRLLQLLLALFLIGSIVLDSVLCIWGFGGVAIINLMIYFYMKQRYEVYLFSLGSLKEILYFGKWMTNDVQRSKLFVNEEVLEAVTELEKFTKWIGNWQGRKYAGMNGDIMYLLNDYLMGMALIDVASFNRIMKVIMKKQDKVMRLYEFAGELDMMISIASFRESINQWCVPKLTCKEKICGKEIVHPLLGQPVANDFCLEKRAMITGANASGKSTFMKALAVNVILAQTIHTCAAKEFYLPKISVMTSMALQDDILTGESYYVREVKYLKRMLDKATHSENKKWNEKEDKQTVLYVIDEMLKGTNTKERLAASAAVLDYFAHADSFVLVATHDTELVWEQQKKYEAYYFESRITEEDILFDYQIHKGIGGSSNAIALLALYEFPELVIKGAKEKLYANW